MASEAQIQENRHNGELSNDFTTAADKERSAQNALKDGLRRRLWVLKPEEHDLLDLAEELWACHAPVGAQEEALVKLMIYDLLTIDRLRRIETSVLSPPKLRSTRLAPNGKEQTTSEDTTIDIIMFSRRLAKVPLETADRMRVYSAWERGTQAAARVLDEIEGKGAQASDEAGDPAQFQQQPPAENGAEAAIESDRQAGDPAQFQQPAISAESVTRAATESVRETENGCAEEANRCEPSRIFEAVAPNQADEILAESFTKNMQLFDLLLRYRINRESAYLKKLHELQRLQAARRGDAVAPPLAVDVNINSNGGAGEREL